MTDHEKRVHELLYSTQSRTELCERVAALEEANAELRKMLQSIVDDYVYNSCGDCWGGLCDSCDCWLSSNEKKLRELGINIKELDE